jgi:hypothetical protein
MYFFLWIFRNKIRFHDEDLLAPRPTPQLEDHPLSTVRDCLFNIFVAALHIEGCSSIRNLRTCHAVVTGIHSSHGRLFTVPWLLHRQMKYDYKCARFYGCHGGQAKVTEWVSSYHEPFRAFLLITNLTHFFMYLFISPLYMFRASQCSSSGGRIVLIHHLVWYMKKCVKLVISKNYNEMRGQRNI